jgi:gamma-glutamyl hercynylcysteine S-oxide synthase
VARTLLELPQVYLRGVELEACLRVSLRARLRDARQRTDSLFALLQDETLRARPVPERHRLIFYLGHLEAFDSNLILRNSLGRKSGRPEFDRLFAFGIDPLETGLPSDQPADWPHVVDVRRYNESRRAAIDAALESTPLFRPAHANLQNGWAVNLAIEHRLMHAETLAYLIHQLPYASKHPGPLPTLLAIQHAPARMIEIPAGRARLGLPRASAPFEGWDNEYEAHDVNVGAFAIESRDVTNGDFLDFVREGGYRERSLWSDEDWAWVRESGREHPAFWVRTPGAWHYRAMFAEVPLSLSRPVYVSHAEAAAFARWRGRALPSEAQFHRAAYGTPEGRERSYPWGETPPVGRRGVFDFQQWDPSAVGTHPGGDSAWGVSDLVGNGWEWTSTPFAPFPGFEPLPFYRGYSADFFDGRHYVMKGGSARTDASLLRRSFRNWFQPHYTYAYATFRCVEPRA